MKKYIIMETSVATKNNPNFAGQFVVSYYGKDQKLIGCAGTAAKSTHTEMELKDYNIKEYGYNRFCDAVRSWIFKNPENTAFWSSYVEIVPIEC